MLYKRSQHHYEWGKGDREWWSDLYVEMQWWKQAGSADSQPLSMHLEVW